MKVYLDLLPGKHHTLYDELINYPPEGVEYQTPSGKIYSTRMYKLFQFLYSHYPNLREIYYLLDRGKGSIHKVNKEDANVDLVQVCNAFVPRDRPWITDIDAIGSFTGYSIHALRFHKKKIENALSLGYCKKIIPWTNAGEKTLERFLEIKNFRNKIEVVYPAIHTVPEKRRHERDKIRLLFMGSITNPETFINKGGEYALKCFEILSKKYDVELAVRSKIPNKIRKKYQTLEGLIFIENLLPKDELFDLYKKSEISLLPGHLFSLMAILESMTFGLPVVSIDGWANSEFIEHGSTGFLAEPSKNVPIIDGVPPGWTPGFWRGVKTIDPKIVGDLVRYSSILVEDGSLRRRMGKRARKRVKNGDLSIKVRNQKLKRIYEEAMKG